MANVKKVKQAKLGSISVKPPKVEVKPKAPEVPKVLEVHPVFSSGEFRVIEKEGKYFLLNGLEQVIQEGEKDVLVKLCNRMARLNEGRAI